MPNTKQPTSRATLVGPKSITVELDEHLDSMGRRVTFYPIDPQTKERKGQVGYYGLPYELLELPEFCGLQVRVTVEIIGVNTANLPQPNPFLRLQETDRVVRDRMFVQWAKRTARKIVRRLKSSVSITRTEHINPPDR